MNGIVRPSSKIRDILICTRQKAKSHCRRTGTKLPLSQTREMGRVIFMTRYLFKVQILLVILDLIQRLRIALMYSSNKK
jgi:hypothetical protein